MFPLKKQPPYSLPSGEPSDKLTGMLHRIELKLKLKLELDERIGRERGRASGWQDEEPNLFRSGPTGCLIEQTRRMFGVGEVELVHSRGGRGRSWAGSLGKRERFEQQRGAFCSIDV